MIDLAKLVNLPTMFCFSAFTLGGGTQLYAGKRPPTASSPLQHSPSHHRKLDTELTINLNSGWTWISLNVEASDMSIATLFADPSFAVGDHIKNQALRRCHDSNLFWWPCFLPVHPCLSWDLH